MTALEYSRRKEGEVSGDEEVVDGKSEEAMETLNQRSWMADGTILGIVALILLSSQIMMTMILFINVDYNHCQRHNPPKREYLWHCCYRCKN